MFYKFLFALFNFEISTWKGYSPRWVLSMSKTLQHSLWNFNTLTSKSTMHILLCNTAYFSYFFCFQWLGRASVNVINTNKVKVGCICMCFRTHKCMGRTIVITYECHYKPWLWSYIKYLIQWVGRIYATLTDAMKLYGQVDACSLCFLLSEMNLNQESGILSVFWCVLPVRCVRLHCKPS